MGCLVLIFNGLDRRIEIRYVVYVEYKKELVLDANKMHVRTTFMLSVLKGYISLLGLISIMIR